MRKQNKKEFHFQTKINPESFPPTNCSVPGVLFFDDTVKEYFLKSKRPKLNSSIFDYFPSITGKVTLTLWPFNFTSRNLS